MRKFIKSITAVSMAAVIIVSGNSFMMGQVYANDHSDTRFTEPFNGVDDVATDPRRKYDASPTYVYNDNSKSDIWVSVNIKGTNRATKFFNCGKGKEIFIRSGGCKGDSVFLQISANTGKQTISGLWSPDSINFTNVYK